MLINRVEDIKDHWPLSINLSFKSIKPFIEMATSKYLLPKLGSEFITHLEELYRKRTYNTAQKKLIEMVHRPLVQFAIHHFLPAQNAKITASGIMAKHSNTEKPAFEHQVRDLYAASLATAYESLEQLLQYLEKNKDQDHVALWKTNVYDKHAILLVPSALEFNRHYAINGKLSTYYVLAPIIERLELLKVEPILGEELYTLIKEFLKDATKSTPTNTITPKLLAYLRVAICNYAIEEGFNEAVLFFGNEGVMQYPSFARMDKKASVNMDYQINRIKETAHDYADACMVTLQDYLQMQADAGKLEAFKSSAAYISPEDISASKDEDDIPGFNAFQKY